MDRTIIHLLDLTFRGTESGGKSGSQEMYDCPFCCGLPGKFAVDRSMMIGKCWECKATARVTDGTPQTREPLPPLPTVRKVRQCVFPEWQELSFLAQTYLLSKKRGLGDTALGLAKRYHLKETCTNGQCTQAGDEWDQRILIPIFQDGQLFTYVACDYTGEQKKKVLSGPNGAAQGAMFYAEPGKRLMEPHMTQHLARLFVVEGCWDAIKVGQFEPTVAILGTGGKWGLSDAQLARILRATHPGSVINIMLDPDAGSKAAKIARQLRSVRPLTRDLTPQMVADPCDTDGATLRGVMA